MPSSAAAGSRQAHVNAAAAAAAMSSDISRRNPQEDYELLQVEDLKFGIDNSIFYFLNDFFLENLGILAESQGKFDGFSCKDGLNFK